VLLDIVSIIHTDFSEDILVRNTTFSMAFLRFVLPALALAGSALGEFKKHNLSTTRPFTIES